MIKRSYLIVAVLAVAIYGLLPSYHPSTLDAAEPAAAKPKAKESPAKGFGSGKVMEVHNASNYTFARVDTGKEKIWLAGPSVQIKAGDKVVFPPGMAMPNFESKSLKRTFDVIYFVDKISREGSESAGGQMPPGHPKVATADTGNQKMDFSRITKPKGGKTVAEVHKEKSQFAGKKISVRGKVVKFNSQVMGKNWLHLMDGTGTQGADDLTITTKASAKVGDTVLVRGTLFTDKDYGHGYKYPVIIEDAEVTVE